MSLCGTINVDDWLKDNKNNFKPPISNQFMHLNQLVVMFVGGPNERLDYHIQDGEEFFLQLKGEMILKTIIQGKPNDIVIKEGEVFLLPKMIPHSPQRGINTMGLVLERSRSDNEFDALRFFTNNDSYQEPLYEIKFPWRKAAHKMAEAFNEFLTSEQFITGKPKPGTVSYRKIDMNTKVENPLNLFKWINENKENIDSSHKMPLFDTNKYKHEITVAGEGASTNFNDNADTWIYQLIGTSTLTINDYVYILGEHDSLLISAGMRYTIKQEIQNYSLICSQNP